MRWKIGQVAVPIVSHQHQHVYFGKAAYTADRVYHSPMATFAGAPGAKGRRLSSIGHSIMAVVRNRTIFSAPWPLKEPRPCGVLEDDGAIGMVSSNILFPYRYFGNSENTTIIF